MIVLDASMAASIVLPDETDPPREVQERVFAGPLVAPAHWVMEITNAVLVAERRQRITADDRAIIFDRIRGLQVELAAADLGATCINTYDLATGYRLTLYDAAYLQLAIDRGAILASNDTDLLNAARACAVPILTSLP